MNLRHAILTFAIVTATALTSNVSWSGPVGSIVRPSKELLEQLGSRDAKVVNVDSSTSATTTPRTIGHLILEKEAFLGTVTPAMYRLLDEIIGSVKSKAPTKPSDTDIAKMRNYVLALMKLIDDSLIERNFIYPPSDELTLTFSDALTPTKLNPGLLKKIRVENGNVRRLSHIEKHVNEDFFLADCDTASFVYLAIADALSLPVYLIEVPEHNFVRFYYSDGTYLNWETIYGEIRTDKHYIDSRHLPHSTIDNGAFMTKMTQEVTLGYAEAVVALKFERTKRTKEAIAHYRVALKTYNRSPLAWNNLSWQLTTTRDPLIRDGKEAVTLAKKAAEIYANGEAMDTLGCAYAECGDFAKAIESETRAVELEQRSEQRKEFQKNLEGFRQNKTWIENHPPNGDPVYFAVGND